MTDARLRAWQADQQRKMTQIVMDAAAEAVKLKGNPEEILAIARGSQAAIQLIIAEAPPWIAEREEATRKFNEQKARLVEEIERSTEVAVAAARLLTGGVPPRITELFDHEPYWTKNYTGKDRVFLGLATPNQLNENASVNRESDDVG